MTPDEAVAYHRTFLLFDPSTHLCKVGCHGTKGLGGKVLVDGPTFSPSGKGNLSNGLPHFPQADLKKVDERTDLRRRGLEAANTFERYTAIQLLSGNSKKVTIVPKLAQDFNRHATEWEKTWSTLAHKGAGGFNPIVDENFTVIGHIGWVSERSLIVPEDTPKFGHNYLKAMLANQPPIPVLVTDVPRPRIAPPGWRLLRAGESWETSMVVTGIDGEVIEQLDGESTNGVTYSVDSFLDYISLAKFAGALVGRAAIRVGSALGRSLSRFGGRLAAEAAARNFSKRALKLQFVRGHQSAMGIPVKHFDAMAAAAKETDMILIFRANKAAAIPWIERGAPGKPFFFKFKSDPQTGVLTAQLDDDFKVVFEKGYYVVAADGKSAYRLVMKGGEKITETIPLKNPFWPVKPNQVIDPKLHKPVVGDYDMLGAAPMKSKGSNVSLVPENPQKGNWSGPHADSAAEAVNRHLGEKRVLHGAQDQSLLGLSDDTAYAVYPDGQVVMMHGRAEQQAFYDLIGRQAGTGSYLQPAGAVIDEVAAMRARRQSGR